MFSVNYNDLTASLEWNYPKIAWFQVGRWPAKGGLWALFQVSEFITIWLFNIAMENHHF